ncbi:MAG: hypothetical protein GY703_12370 [Gammaproteobacteria bacterium]|nr:hypothetical protein [Gammaproteobacteria bacterium]
MKKIIDGKLYDTETAAAITCNKHKDETLYKTQKGAWFTYLQEKDKGRLKAFTPQEALDWCEIQGIDTDTVCKHFDIEDA